jgi:hypothetical protein
MGVLIQQELECVQCGVVPVSIKEAMEDFPLLVHEEPIFIGYVELVKIQSSSLVAIEAICDGTVYILIYIVRHQKQVKSSTQEAL